MIARDIMDTRFHTLSPEQTIAEAVGRFRAASLVEDKNVFGMMVVEAIGYERFDAPHGI